MFIVLFVIAGMFGITIPQLLTASAASGPNIITYQGRVLNTNGVPVSDASVDMIFALYDASSGGTCLWSNSSASCATSTARSVTLTNGLFSEDLGDTGDSYAAIGTSVFADNASVYLQVTIEGETLSPRKQISSSPYAFNATRLNGLASTAFLSSTGDTGTGDYDFTGAILTGASALQFEGLTDDDFQTTFAFTDPTADRTITFQDGTGTVAFLSDIGGGSSLFTDGGTTTYLTSTSDDLAIGGSNIASSPLGVDVSANTVYVGSGSTANAQMVWKASDGDTGTLSYTTSDQWYFNGGSVAIETGAGIDTGLTVTSATSSGTPVNVTANSLTSGNGVSLNTSSLVTGNLLDLNITSGALQSGDYVNITHDGTYASTTTLSGNGIDLVRDVELDDSGAGTETLSVTGALLSLSDTSTLTSGSAISHQASVLSLAQNYSSSTGDAISITNAGTGSAIQIAQTGYTGGLLSSSQGGAIHINNTSNNGSGFTIYSNNDASASQPLLALFADNTAFDQALVDILSDGTGSAITAASRGTGDVLSLEQQSTSGIGIDLDADQITTGTAIYTVATALTTGTGLHVELQDTLTTGQGILVNYNASGTPGADAIVVQSDIGATDRDVFVVEVDGDVQIGSGTLCVDSDGSCAGGVDGTIYAPGGVTSSSSDLAEIYPSSESLEAGDIVVIDTAEPGSIHRSTNAYENEAISAIATAPAFLMGAPNDDDLIAAGIDVASGIPNWGNHMILPGTYPVALAGRIPVKVNTQNGAIAIGDLITTSSTAGVGMKATAPGSVIGRALEAYSGSGTGLIEVYIQAGWHSGNTIVQVDGDATFTTDFTFEAIDLATEDDNAASRALSFSGSAWIDGEAVDREMLLFTDVQDADHYQLSIANTAGDQVAYITQDGDLALAGKLYLSDRGAMQTDKYVYYDGSSGSGGDFIRTNAAGWGSGSYDFAEMFPSTQQLQAGEVVVFADAVEHVERAANGPYDQKIAGIVSTEPGFLAGENIDGHYPIALAGRVPTYVTTENGAIAIGDPLTTSSTAGYAMKATEEGPIVGYALASLSYGEGMISVFVRPSYYDGRSMESVVAEQNTVSGLAGSIQSFDATGSLNVMGGTMLNVGSIQGIGNAWSISETGDFMTTGRVGQLVRSYQNELVETFAAVSPQSTIQYAGTVKMTNGFARVKFDDVAPELRGILSAEHDYRVLVTASSATGPLFVADRDMNGFRIQESGGKSSTQVDWLVIGYHKDYAPEVPVEDGFIESDSQTNPSTEQASEDESTTDEQQNDEAVADESTDEQAADTTEEETEGTTDSENNSAAETENATEQSETTATADQTEESTPDPEPSQDVPETTDPIPTEETTPAEDPVQDTTSTQDETGSSEGTDTQSSNP